MKVTFTSPKGQQEAFWFLFPGPLTPSFLGTRMYPLSSLSHVSHQTLAQVESSTSGADLLCQPLLSEDLICECIVDKLSWATHGGAGQ